MKIEEVVWPRPPRSVRTRRPSSYLCPNCGGRFEPEGQRRLYCSLRCDAEADLVRYARRKHRQHGAELPPEVREALKIRMAHALAGGYDEARRRIAQEMRSAVWRRDRDRCAICQAPGEEIDHLDGPSNDLTNLRLLCKPCHRAVTYSRFRRITDPTMLARRDALLHRMYAPGRVQPCDAPNWQGEWQRWIKDHAAYSDHVDLASNTQTPELLT